MLVFALVVGASFFVAFRRWSRPVIDRPRDANALLVEAETGNERAVRALIDQLQGAASEKDEPLLARMLQSDQALVRAAACTTIGREHEKQFSAALFCRLSDDDWRVRAAGFEALHNLGGEELKFDSPLRDTPVEVRETTILTILSQWRKQTGSLPALPQLCEMYPTLKHWLVGPVLMESCLACHAPAQQTYSSSTRCMSCHAQIHKTWFASAHSRSISHLPLARVDPETKKVVLWDYGAREGLDCLTCHREASVTSTSTNVSPAQPPLAPSRHRFDRATPAAQSCAACHSETQQQWETWQSHPRPRNATWPPDTIEWVTQSPAPSCVDCHMRQIASPIDKALPHSFTARRNPELLIGGLKARIESATQQHPARVILTNLAGHSYPAGTHRRSLRVEALYDGDPSTRVLLARLKTKDPVPATQPYQEVLAPGEERSIEIPLRANASTVTCDITYERNAYVDIGYEVTLAHLTQKLHD
jgi:hypothetical protein